MPASWIQLPLDGGGKAVDAVSLTTTAAGAPNASTVVREVHVLGDPNTFAAVAAVGSATPAGTEYGLLTRNIPSGVQDIRITTPAGSAASPPVVATNMPYGYLRVSPEASTLFYDPFDNQALSAIRWKTPVVSGAGTAAVGFNGRLLVSSGATNPGAATLSTVPTFVGKVPGFLQISFALALEYPRLTTSNHRFWGMGTTPTTPTVAAPLTDAIGFMTDATGNIFGTVWQSGTMIYQSASIGTAVADANQHRYIAIVRTDRVYFYIDSLDVPLATASFMVPATQTLPLLVQSVTAAAQNVALDIQGLAAADTGRNAAAIADPTNPFNQAAVLTTTPTGTEAGLLTRVTGPLPAGTNTIGGIINPADNVATGTLTAAAASSVTGTANTTGTVVAAVPAGASDWIFQFTGTAASGTSQIAFEASPDGGTTWVPVNGRQSGLVNTVLAFQPTITSVPVVFRGNSAGFTHLRARMAVLGGTDAITVRINCGVGQGATFLNASLPAGTNTIGSISPNPDATTTGTLTATALATVTGTTSTFGTVVLAAPAGSSDWVMQFTGTATSTTSQIAFEGSADGGTTWVGMNGRQSGSVNTTLVTQATIASVPLVYRGNDAGFTHIRARMAVLGGTDAITVRINAGIGAGGTFLTAGLPTGANTIGSVSLTGAGTAGTAAGPVQTVQGQAGMTPVQIQPAALAGFAGTITTATGIAGPWTVSTLGNLTLVITGTYAGFTGLFEASVDNTNWFGILGGRTDSFNAETGPITLTNTVRAWDFPMLGIMYFRVRATALTSGTVSLAAQGGVIPIEPSPTIGGAVTTTVTQKRTYQIVGRNLSFTTTAATAKQWLDIWHASTVTTTVNIKKVMYTVQSNNLANILTCELVRITAAPSSGIAVTPAPYDASNATTTTSGMSLPTTAGTESTSIFSSQTLNLGTIAGTTAAPTIAPITLYQWLPGDDSQPLRIRSGQTEGFAFRVTPTAATTVVLTIWIEFTEE